MAWDWSLLDKARIVCRHMLRGRYGGDIRMALLLWRGQFYSCKGKWG